MDKLLLKSNLNRCESNGSSVEALLLTVVESWVKVGSCITDFELVELEVHEDEEKVGAMVAVTESKASVRLMFCSDGDGSSVITDGCSIRSLSLLTSDLFCFY